MTDGQVLPQRLYEGTVTMPKLERSEWYDLCRDMNWCFKYVTDAEVFPEALSQSHGIPASAWWSWDEPYKISYREYVDNQAEKDAGVYSVRSAMARSRFFENLDPGWKAAIIAHYGAIAIPEYLASIGEARMGRFGRAAAWRNMALYGTLDETRHGQIQLSFPHALLKKEPRFDWAHKAMHTNEWGVIALRHIFDDMFTANDAVSTAIQLTFTFETGFTNLQFLGMAADAMETGDVEFGTLISSIQTDEARHAQQGEPTLRVLIQNGKKAEAQRLVDAMFWRSWRMFALLTGLSMDYYTPLVHRSMSFKEFMLEWIIKQFTDQFRDLGLERPWYWDLFIQELDWLHHAYHLGVWFWRPTVWWNPDAGVSVAEREWLEAKYPGWHDRFGTYWQTIAENLRQGAIPLTYPETLPVVCNMCQIPVCSSTILAPPRLLTHGGRVYSFCSDPCKWIFEQNPTRYAGHLSIVDRFLAGHIQPPDLEGALAYMGLSPGERGVDATSYAWAFEQAPQAAAVAS
jgi:toluene monooxygenase system protein A